MEKKLQQYEKILDDLQSEKSVLDKKINKTMEKIAKLNLIINPPWWTQLDDEFSIFQGLIEHCECNKESSTTSRPAFSESASIKFTNGSYVCYSLEDEYGDGDQVSAFIDGYRSYKKIHKSLTEVLVGLKIEASDSNIKKLVDLLERAADTPWSFDMFFGWF